MKPRYILERHALIGCDEKINPNIDAFEFKKIYGIKFDKINHKKPRLNRGFHYFI